MSSFILFLVLALFAYVLFSSQQIKSYALKKDSSITVSIVTQAVKKEVEKKVEEKKETVLPQNNENSEDISSLFSNVWTKSIKPVKEIKQTNIDENKLLRLTKKVKSVNKNDVKSLKEKVDNTNFAKADVQVKSDDSSSGEEVNEFLAKIQAEIYNNFYPPQNTQGQSAKILIRLSESGEVLDFRILTYSGDEIFNAEVDRLKNRIEMLKFPANPDNKAGNYVITLIAKE